MTTRLATTVLLAFALLISVVARAEPDPSPVATLTDRTIAEMGRTSVIPFRVTPADSDRAFRARVEDPELLLVVREPSALSGEEIGYLRVLGLAEGTTRLHVGSAAIDVQVLPSRTPAHAERFLPRIVGPTTGAAAWHAVAVGVEVLIDPNAPPEQLMLRLSTGREISPSETNALGSHRYATFELGLGDLEPGPLELTPIARGVTGLDRAGASVRITVLNPDKVIAGEAEGRYDIERPRRFADERLMIGRDRRASGGAYFSNAASYPAVCFPIQIVESGYYQMMVVAAGSRAGGALPTVSLIVDGGDQGVTNGRLLSEDWHRVTVGVPVPLESGMRVLTPYFANDFYVPTLADRNMRLDRIEVVRVSTSGGVLPEDGAGAMQGMAMRPASMSGGAMTMLSSMRAPGGIGSAYGSTTTGSAYAQDGAPLRLAFERVLDGLPVSGGLEVRGQCWAEDVDPRQGPSGTPVVSLIVNGEQIASQRAMAPRFWIDAAAFAAGENTVQMRAVVELGATVATAPQRVWYDPSLEREPRQPAAHLRFSVHDERWGESLRTLLTTERYPLERFAAAFYAEGEATLELPEELTGRYTVFVEMLGEHFQGAPIARVRIDTDDRTTEVGQVEARTWWEMREIGDVVLDDGPKRLVVEFTNDAYEAGTGDRNLWLQSVALLERPEWEDRTAPIAKIRYPVNGERMWMADAVVVEVADDEAVESVDVLIDELDTGVSMPLRGQPGRVVLPLALRGLSPGEHTLTVRVVDAAGNQGIAESRKIIVLDEEPAKPTRYARAVHLLDRLAFGPSGRELADVLVRGEREWLEDRLAAGLDTEAERAALGLGLVRFAAGSNQYEVSRRVVDHAIRTPNPVRMRFVLWAQNHFSTWIRKTEADRKWTEHVRFSSLGPAPFLDLLTASAESPAMLRYLDQDQSYAGQINENYPREIMELHTLGVDGGFSQADVTALAHLLTGWTATGEGDGRGGGVYSRAFTFRFDPRLSDGRARQVIGMSFDEVSAEGQHDRLRLALETLASHPSTAQYIAEKLAEHYVAVPAPEPLVGDLAEVFLKTGGDMGAMLLALAEHEEFWSSTGQSRLARPLDFAIRLARASSWDHPWGIGAYLDRSGAGLFDRATPDGYPEDDAAYSDSNALIQRWRLAKEAEWSLAGLAPNRVRWTQTHNSDEWRQRVVDLISIRLTGSVLSGPSNEAAVGLLKVAEGPSDQQVLQVATLIAQLPEANRR